MPNIVRPLLLLCALAASATSVSARDNSDPARLPETVRRVERETGGEVLSAKRTRGDRETTRVKVLTPEGRVRVLHEDRARGDRGQQRPEPRGRPRGERD
ncbi:MAG TPA: hypothetical protein VFG21_03680 [Xanthomonadaceae bacterium]|nr:hypothetical protein [Xanthomonadaceae bacterium]